MQAIKFGGTFDQLFLWIFLWNCHRRSPSTSSIPWCKKSQKWPKTQIKGGPALNTWTSDHSLWLILLFEKEQSSVKGLKVIVQPEAPCTTSLVNTQCTCCSSLGWVVRFHSIFPLNLLCCLHSLTASVCFAPPCDIGSAWDRIVHLSLHRHTSTKFYGRGCFRPVRCYIARWVASVCSNQSSLGANIFSKHIIAFLRIVQVRSHITVLQLSKVSSRNQKKEARPAVSGKCALKYLDDLSDNANPQLLVAEGNRGTSAPCGTRVTTRTRSPAHCKRTCSRVCTFFPPFELEIAQALPLLLTLSLPVSHFLAVSLADKCVFSIE